MIFLIILIMIIATCIFPYLWVIVPIAMLVLYILNPFDYNEDIEKYKRQKRLDECRKRRYGNKRRF
jgi:hypothetical protein